jgi:hypothetical protein
MELLNKCIKSACIKGDRKIPGNPFTERGKIPKPEKSNSNIISVILTSHIREIIKNGMIRLRSNFFL